MNNQPMSAEHKAMSYKKFAITMLISFVVMYTLMFVNMIEIAHYHTSITRVYMAVIMVSAMAVVMMLLMGKMYPDKKTNRGIIMGGIAVLIIFLVALRSQVPVGDVQYMKAMIPHHSSAILTSERADIKNPEVKKLAEDIIAAQRKEIAEMEAFIQKLDK